MAKKDKIFKDKELYKDNKPSKKPSNYKENLKRLKQDYKESHYGRK